MNHWNVSSKSLQIQFSLLMKLLFYKFGPCSIDINFIDCYYKRNFILIGQLNHFQSLRLDSLDSWYYQDNNISWICSSHSHIWECLMPWSINERNMLSLWCNHMKSSNFLCNSSKFSLCNLTISQIIKKSSFSMIDVAHNCHHRRPKFKCSLIFFTLYFHIIL